MKWIDVEYLYGDTRCSWYSKHKGNIRLALKTEIHAGEVTLQCIISSDELIHINVNDHSCIATVINVIRSKEKVNNCCIVRNSTFKETP